MLRRSAARLLGSLLGETGASTGAAAAPGVSILNQQHSAANAFAVSAPTLTVIQVAGLTTSTPRGECHGKSSGGGSCQEEIQYPAPKAFVGQPAPGFSVPAVVDGEIKTVSLDDFKGKWKVLFFYPKDFTFVCPTEIIAFNDARAAFEAINCQLIAASCDSAETHLAWVRTPRKKGGLGHMAIPILADLTKSVSNAYGVLIKDLGIPLRGLFVIDEQNIVQQITINALPIGRSVDEALRLVQASQFFQTHGEVCPAGWKPGHDSMIADPVGSLDYFSKTYKDDETADAFAPSVPLMKTPEELRTAIAKGKTVVDFYAPWCGKCRQIAPAVSDLQAQYKGKVNVVKVDTTMDGFGAITEEMGVKSLPTFKFFNEGKEVKDVKEVVGYKKVPLAEAFNALSKA